MSSTKPQNQENKNGDSYLRFRCGECKIVKCNLCDKYNPNPEEESFCEECFFHKNDDVGKLICEQCRTKTCSICDVTKCEQMYPGDICYQCYEQCIKFIRNYRQDSSHLLSESNVIKFINIFSCCPHLNSEHGITIIRYCVGKPMIVIDLMKCHMIPLYNNLPQYTFTIHKQIRNLHQGAMKIPIAGKMFNVGFVLPRNLKYFVQSGSNNEFLEQVESETILVSITDLSMHELVKQVKKINYDNLENIKEYLKKNFSKTFDRMYDDVKQMIEDGFDKKSHLDANETKCDRYWQKLKLKLTNNSSISHNGRNVSFNEWISLHKNNNFGNILSGTFVVRNVILILPQGSIEMIMHIVRCKTKYEKFSLGIFDNLE